MRTRFLAVLATALLSTTAAHAEESKASSETVPTLDVDRERAVIDMGPNRLLLATGVATVGFSYLVSAYVGLTNERPSEQWLVVPLAGPWVAFARRERCSERCEGEDAYRALFVVDGIVQLAGVVQMVAAFSKRELKERERPVVTPFTTAGGAGIAAFGRF